MGETTVKIGSGTAPLTVVEPSFVNRLIVERDRAHGRVVSLETVVAECAKLLAEALPLMNHASDCPALGPRWVIRPTGYGGHTETTCRACGVAPDSERTHRHDCNCGYNALAARIAAEVAGWRRRGE